MKVVIIENDTATTEQLEKLLRKVSERMEITRLPSLTEANSFFKSNHFTDIVFIDIKSGSAFKHKKLNIPVIYFSTHMQYAIKAFDNSGSGFILKPFTKKNISDSIERYKTLRNLFNNPLAVAGYNGSEKDKHASSLIVNWKDKIIPVKIKDIALFNIEYKMTQVVTFNNRKYFITDTLEGLEDICGPDFYRANRQFLINRDAVAEATQHFARKLVLKLKVEGEYEIIISKNRVPEFLGWLRN